MNKQSDLDPSGGSAPEVPGATSTEASAQSAEMGADQQAALKEVARLRGEYGKAPYEGRDALAQRMAALSKFAFGHGEKPKDFLPGDPPPLDLRPHDPLRNTFETVAQPATELQTKGAVSLAVLQGVNRELAEGIGGLCAELQLSESHTKAVLDRVRAHAGADYEFAAANDIDVLADHEIGEWYREASRILGSAEKLHSMRERARAFVKSRGLAEKYEKMNFWRSTLSFDPKLLHTLTVAANRAGVPNGSK